MGATVSRWQADEIVHIDREIARQHCVAPAILALGRFGGVIAKLAKRVTRVSPDKPKPEPKLPEPDPDPAEDEPNFPVLDPDPGPDLIDPRPDTPLPA